MSERILHLTLHIDDWRFDEEKLKNVINDATDWVRYSPDCWLLLTARTAAEWYGRLRPFLGQHDELLIMPVEFDTCEGFLSESVASWIRRHTKAKNAA